MRANEPSSVTPSRERASVGPLAVRLDHVALATGLVALLICTTVATCGQKGPLRLPDDQQAVAPLARHAF